MIAAALFFIVAAFLAILFIILIGLHKHKHGEDLGPKKKDLL